MSASSTYIFGATILLQGLFRHFYADTVAKAQDERLKAIEAALAELKKTP